MLKPKDYLDCSESVSDPSQILILVYCQDAL